MTLTIEPINSLAFSISANKGVYALLLGSGVSRSSSIPTGWEITLDLVRRVAALKGADCEPDPAKWFLDTHGAQPDYSDLLDALCKSPAERQQLVRYYIEPSEEEREDGLKEPTPAHRAIAELVKSGYIRVILTTNFDKLLELALQDVGVTPTVLSSVDHIAGALPLVHTQCTIIKIHGDYLDTRILNTASELADYPDEFKQLLDRVFDEYGLIVCGWSADWDEALRAALIRSPYRRFSTYWASRGAPGEKAADLILRRAANLIPIDGADTFFSKLSETVSVLEAFSKPHPLSTAAAVVSLKKYLSEDKYAIQLDDLISEETSRVHAILHGPSFPMLDNIDVVSFGDRARSYESVSTTLIEMAVVAGYWSKPNQLKPWIKAIGKLAQYKFTSGLLTVVDFQRYPACLITFAFGLGAVASGNLFALKEILNLVITNEYKDAQFAAVALGPISMFEHGTNATKLLPGKDRHHIPLNSWIEDFFDPLGTSLFQSKKEYRTGLDKLEFLWMLVYANSIRDTEGNYFWVPFGNFIYRRGSFDKLLSETRESITNLGEASPYVQSKLFGSTAKECTDMLLKVQVLGAQWTRGVW